MNGTHPRIPIGGGSKLDKIQGAIRRLTNLIKGVYTLDLENTKVLSKYKRMQFRARYNQLLLETSWLQTAFTSLTTLTKSQVDWLDDDVDEFDWETDETFPPEEVAAARLSIEERIRNTRIKLEEKDATSGMKSLNLGLPVGREFRWIKLDEHKIMQLSKVSFERYSFLSGLDAICSFDDDLIEAGIKLAGLSSNLLLRRLLPPAENFEQQKLILAQYQDNFPSIELSCASEVFLRLCYRGDVSPTKITIKIRGGKIKTHDQALKQLVKIANATFFQIEMLSDVAIVLDREKKGGALSGRGKRLNEVHGNLQYPRTEFDQEPMSLYWYAKSAAGLPLLQFLAFYQVIEYYFPSYSRSDAHRKLKAILKEPTFRADRDADIGRLLSSIYISRSGSYGDERSQLKATIMECVDSQSLREFIETKERSEFYRKKDGYHPITINTSGKGLEPDYRADVSERIYNIRCKIVHTKNEGQDNEVEVLLPFSKEADRLFYDLELVQFLARRVLIAASSPLTVVQLENM